MKKCSKCLETKNLIEFWKCKGQKDGHQSYCKTCYKIQKAEYIKNNPGFQSKHNKLKYQRHKEKIKEINKLWKETNKELRKKQSKEYYKKNIKRILKYNNENKEKIKLQRRKYRERTTQLHAYYGALREWRIKRAMPKWADKNKIKIIYKESRKKTMQTGIQHHVDHIIPIVHKLVCGLHIPENLQILTASENSTKQNKINLDMVNLKLKV